MFCEEAASRATLAISAAASKECDRGIAGGGVDGRGGDGGGGEGADIATVVSDAESASMPTPKLAEREPRSAALKESTKADAKAEDMSTLPGGAGKVAVTVILAGTTVNIMADAINKGSYSDQLPKGEYHRASC